MTNTLLLNAEIMKSGLKRDYIAKELGISLNSLGKKINNKVEFKASEIYTLRKILYITNLTNLDNIFFAQNVDLK